ncbi:MAG: DMT family transporter [Bacteroidota bacterium]
MMNRTTVFLAVAFVLLWNSGFIGAEYGLPYTGPFTLLFWRYLVLTLVVFLYLIVRRRFHWVGWRIAAANMLIGVLAHGVWLTCVLLALDNQVPAGVVALVVALQPLLTGALSPMVVGERTTTYQWIGLVLGFLGVFITVLFRIDFDNSSSVFGYLIPLGSVIGITIASLIQRQIDIRNSSRKLPMDLTLFYQSFATTLALALPAIFIEQLSTQWEPEFIYTMIWLIFAVSLGAYALMWILIDRIEATRVASFFYLGPPVTMVMAWLIFDDKVQTMDITGLVVVFIGVILTQYNNEKYHFKS